MDKFYFNNKAIYLRNSDAFPGSKDIELFYEYTNIDNFYILVQKMDELDVVESICLFNDNFDRMHQEVMDFFRPIEAAGGVVQNPKGQFLFIKRHDVWDLPKGKIEKGESPKEAALREVQEETGLANPKIIRPLTKTYHAYQHGEKYMLKTNHWFLMECDQDETLTPQTEESITEVRWFDNEEISWARASTYTSLHELIDLLTHENA